MNFRPGYLEQGSPLGNLRTSVMLSADDQVINTQNVAYLALQSDNTTAGNRTFTLTSSTLDGQMLYIVFESGSSTSCQLADSGNVALSAAWEPTQYDALTLMWDNTATKWVEVARSQATGLPDIPLPSGEILVGSSGGLASAVAMSGDATISNAGVVSLASGALLCESYSVGFAALNAATSGVAALFGTALPDNAIIKNVIYDVTGTFQDNGTAGDADTSTIKIGLEDQDNDVVAAIAISNGAAPWDAGLHDTIEDGAAANALKLSAARQLAVTWTAGSGDATALVAGAMDVYVFWVQGS